MAAPQGRRRCFSLISTNLVIAGADRQFCFRPPHRHAQAKPPVMPELIGHLTLQTCQVGRVDVAPAKKKADFLPGGYAKCTT